jgi:hypothetical protein
MAGQAITLNGHRHLHFHKQSQLKKAEMVMDMTLSFIAGRRH